MPWTHGVIATRGLARMDTLLKDHIWGYPGGVWGASDALLAVIAQGSDDLAGIKPVMRINCRFEGAQKLHFLGTGVMCKLGAFKLPNAVFGTD